MPAPLLFLFRALAFASGLGAIALLMLPLLLALLMLLFNRTAEALLVLTGALMAWIGGLLPGGGGTLPGFVRLALDPVSVALLAALRLTPCLGGLLLAALRPRDRRTWWAVLPLWGLSAWCDGALVAIALGPGLAASVALALLPPPPAVDRSRARPA